MTTTNKDNCHQNILFTNTDNCKKKEISNCKSVERILNTYHPLITNQQQLQLAIDNLITTQLRNINCCWSNLFDDFVHIKTQHHLTKNHSLFNTIYKYLDIVYDKQIYAYKKQCFYSVIGFIRFQQHIYNISIPCEISETIFNYHYFDYTKNLLTIQPQTLNNIKCIDERYHKLCYWLDCCIFPLQTDSELVNKKKQVLNDILDFLETSENVWSNRQILTALMKMIKANLFRSLPYTHRISYNIPDYHPHFSDNEEFEDPYYPYLSVIYEVTLMFVRNINVDHNIKKRYINKSFIISLMQLLASEDIRERECVTVILHSIYSRNVTLRRLIRTEISNCCYRVIYSEHDAIGNGMSECLQLLCSIIQGLATPIKYKYKQILYDVLIPLHKVNSRKLHKFHEMLMDCCVQFVLKDVSIGLDILIALLKYWPFQSGTKCELFLQEIIIIINTMFTVMEAEKDFINVFEYDERGIIIREKLIDKLIECVVNDNVCLCKQTLLSFSEVGIQKLIDINQEKSWTSVLYVLFDYRDNKTHWFIPLHKVFDDVLNVFIKRDAKYVQKLENLYRKNNTKIQNKCGTVCRCTGIQKNRISKYKQIHIMANNNKYNKHLSVCNKVHSISSKDRVV